MVQKSRVNISFLGMYSCCMYKIKKNWIFKSRLSILLLEG
jgi:hypothetical protein